MRCLIVTSNMVEAEDLKDLVTFEYGMQVHTYRDIHAVRDEITGQDSVNLMFLSVEYEPGDIADVVQAVRASGGNIVLIDGSKKDADCAVGFLRRPYSTQDVSHIMSDLT